MDDIASAVSTEVGDALAVRLQDGVLVAEMTDDCLCVFTCIPHVVAIIGTETVSLAEGDIGDRGQG